MTWNDGELFAAKQNPPLGIVWFNSSLFPRDGAVIGELNGIKIYYKRGN